MKKSLLILLIVVAATTALSQSVDFTIQDHHGYGMWTGKRPIPYPYLRETDVVWSTNIWKTIDLRELFNQYIYFPLDDNDRSGKLSLAYVLWQAIERDEIPIFEDDELKIPLDNKFFIDQYTKADTILLEIGYDDDDNEIYQTVIVPKHFDGAEIFQYWIREVWFIGKEETRQDSRRIAIAPTKDIFHTLKKTGEEIYMGHAALFWVPMQNPIVRALLARNIANLYDNNMAQQPSWDYIFVNQVYSAYITQESNRYNRSISKYLTGKDALLEAEAIEQKVYEIGEDMWEY